MTVIICINTSKQVGDPDHLKVFANADAAETWLEEAQRGGGWRGKASAEALYRVQLFSRRNTQSEIASPLLMSACTRPLIMKVGDT